MNMKQDDYRKIQDKDLFVAERKAAEFCRTYNYEEGSREYEVAVNAFCVGYSIGSKEKRT